MPRSRQILALFLIACGAGGCHRQPHEDLLAKGVFLFNEAKFEEAIPVLKNRLLENPSDPGAHLYLGRSYLAIVMHDPKKAYLAIAEGEIRTALNVFIRGGRHSNIERFGDAYFEIACHLQLSAIHLSQAAFLEGLGAAPEAVDEKLREIEAENRAIRAIVPDSPEAKQYDEEIANIRKRIGIVPAQSHTV